jgi:hypothetical protein
MYTYRVDCWVNPKSGLDLSEQNRFLIKFKKMMSSLLPENNQFQKALDNFAADIEGMVLESIIVESDVVYEKNEKEIINAIRRKRPEAVIASHTKLKLEKAKIHLLP